MGGLGLVRKLVRALLGLAVLSGAYLGVFSIFASFRSYPLTAVPTTPAELRGAYHVHTLASDGRGSVEEVAAAAKRAGLSFVITTDHNLAALPPARYVGGVLVVPGIEITTPMGHLTSLICKRKSSGKQF